MLILNISDKLVRNIVFIFSCLILTISCKQNNDQITPGVPWSSADPASIPLQDRVDQYRKGNLVQNFSFEEGRYFSENKLNSFDIKSWNKVGNSGIVSWVDTSQVEIPSGIKALYMSNNKRDEHPASEVGIESDFIKIIPGNYEFSFFIKLRDIKSHIHRKGNRLSDAINIRLLYFDKNKIKVSSSLFDPVHGMMIDGGFVGLQFSPFYTIDSLNWVKVKARTTGIHLTEGDVPDNTRYMKIHLGLKGTGEIWLDNINLNYSNKNFSLAYLMKKEEEEKYSIYDLLLPVPQKISNPKALYLKMGDNRVKKYSPVYFYSQKYKGAAKILIGELYKKGSQKNNVQPLPCTHVKKSKNGFCFFIGYPIASASYLDSINSKEAYSIIHDDSLQAVFVNAKSIQGYRYAIQTIAQLLDLEKDLYHHADIIDFPSFKERILACDTSYIQKDLLLFAENNRFTDLLLRTQTEEGCKVYNSKVFGKKGRQVIIKEKISENYFPSIIKNSENIYVTEWFNSNEKILKAKQRQWEQLYKTISYLPEKIGFAWQGYSSLSDEISFLDYKFFGKIIGERNFLIWENSLNKDLQIKNIGKLFVDFPGKRRLLCLFAPFDRKLIDLTLIGNVPPVLISTHNLSEFDKISAETAAIYLWNPNKYDPIDILWKLLIKNYGMENAKELIRFNDAYYHLEEIYGKKKCKISDNRGIHILNDVLQKLELSFLRLKVNLKSNDLLIKELESYYKEIQKKCGQVKYKSKPNVEL